MGIYDRSYYQDDQPRGIFLGGSGGGPQTLVTKIVILNVAIFLIDILFFKDQLSRFLAVYVGTLERPWEWWRLLTMGFAHSPHNIGHVAFNMVALWFLGRAVEEKLGKAEFLRFYLTAIVLASIAWLVSEKLAGAPAGVTALGASGAVYAVVIAFAMYFPHVRLLLFFAIPIPAWALGAMYIVGDVFQMIKGPGDGPHIAHFAHFGGAIFAFLYVKLHWNLSWMSPAWLGRLKPRSGPRLRVHDPDSKRRDLDNEVDQILRKIKRDGEDSLTRRERQIMKKASREYQDRKQS